MTAIPPRLRPLLDAGVAGAAARAPARRRRPRVLPRRRQRARRVPRPRDARRRGRRHRHHDRRPPRRRRAARAAVGRRTCGCRASGSAPSAASKDGTTLEITTFRAEVYRPESRKPEVAFSDDIETDLSRRDFTVNAMALRLPEPDARRPVRRRGRPRRPPAAHAAGARGVVRSTTRCACCARRASSRSSGSSPTPSSSRRSGELRHRLEIVSAERIRDELSKLLLVDDPTRRPVVPRRDRARRRVPARAQRDAARAGPDPHAQGRARAHDRGRAQHPARS